MSEDIKVRSDKINQLNTERKPIIYIEIRHNSLETGNINKNKKIFKNDIFLVSYYKDEFFHC